MVLDAQQCLQQGLIGALGAIPGTIAAHPLDLTKIRMQVDSSVKIREAFQHTAKAPFRGLSAGIQQKVLTRGPMFFCSEVGTQLCQRWMGLPREKAVVLGSFASGYATGFTASLTEWSKVQRGVSASNNSSGSSNSALRLARTCLKEGQLLSLGRRMRGAGLRNAIFDSTFFGVEHGLRTQYQLPSYLSFSLAAATALCIDYPIDVTVKRFFAVVPHQEVPHGPVLSTINCLKSEGLGVFSGLSVKAMEFGCSYCVTGAFAPLVSRGFMAFAAVVALSTYS